MESRDFVQISEHGHRGRPPSCALTAQSNDLTVLKLDFHAIHRYPLPRTASDVP